MATYVILGKLSPEAIRAPVELRELEDTVSQKMKVECPNVRWKESYAVMGRFDVVDIVEADDPADLGKAAMIIRAYGRTQTETMPARPWKDFLASL
jgi:uncharacterized protein with GYD domain